MVLRGELQRDSLPNGDGVLLDTTDELIQICLGENALRLRQKSTDPLLLLLWK